MLSFLGTVGAWLGRRFASWGLGSLAGLAFLGPLGGLITGIANAIGSALTAIFEIIASLSKSPEGRVVLALLMGGLGFLWVRYHYIEEGKASVKPVHIVKTVTKRVIVPAKCPTPVRRNG